MVRSLWSGTIQRLLTRIIRDYKIKRILVTSLKLRHGACKLLFVNFRKEPRTIKRTRKWAMNSLYSAKRQKRINKLVYLFGWSRKFFWKKNILYSVSWEAMGPTSDWSKEETRWRKWADCKHSGSLGVCKKRDENCRTNKKWRELTDKEQRGITTRYENNWMIGETLNDNNVVMQWKGIPPS